MSDSEIIAWQLVVILSIVCALLLRDNYLNVKCLEEGTDLMRELEKLLKERGHKA